MIARLKHARKVLGFRTSLFSAGVLLLTAACVAGAWQWPEKRIEAASLWSLGVFTLLPTTLLVSLEEPATGDEVAAKATLTLVFQLITTWSFAATLAYGIRALVGEADAKAWIASVSLFLLLVAQIAGLFALQRSTQAHANAQFAREALRFLLMDSPTLSGLAIAARWESNLADVLGNLQIMLRQAVALPLTTGEVDEASLWVRSGDQWLLLLSTSKRHVPRSLGQDVVARVTPGAGMVTNLAASRENDGVLLISDGVRHHAWWKPQDGDSSAGVALVLLNDANDEAVGCLCFTSSAAGAIPDAGPHADRLQSMLRAWGPLFALAVTRFRELASSLSTAPAAK